MQEKGHDSNPPVLARQLDYLTTLGWSKLFTLISNVEPKRLLELSDRADHAKILRLLTDADLERNIHFLKTLTVDDLVAIIGRCPIDDLVLMVREGDPEEIDRFIAAFGIQFNVDLLLRIGASSVLRLLSQGGSQRWIPVLEAVEPERLLHLLDGVMFSDVEKLADRLPADQLRRWFAGKSVDETVLLFRFLGAENLIKLFDWNGLEGSLALLELLSTEKTILLIHEIRKMKLPRMLVRDRRSLEERQAH